MLEIGKIKINRFPLLLAPMDGVTDVAFRVLCKSMGADMSYTEFISSEAIIRDVPSSMSKLELIEAERPIGIQIYGHTIESMKQAAATAATYKPDLIDINMGCSIKRIVSKGCGAALLGDVPKLVEMAAAVVQATHIPVTVKTRLGWDESRKNIEEIVERLQDVGVQAITIHGRTKAQIYKGNADWTLIGKIKNNPRIHIPIFGNGDVTSAEIALDMKNKYGVDGIMIGRGTYGNPWIFKECRALIDTGTPAPPIPLQERVDVCKAHLAESLRIHNERFGIINLRQHYGHYFKGIADIKAHRIKLQQANTQEEVNALLDEIPVKFSLAD